MVHVAMGLQFHNVLHNVSHWVCMAGFVDGLAVGVASVRRARSLACV